MSSFLPQLDSCRFITINEINKRMKEDNFTYKAVRVLGKLKQLQDLSTGYAIIEQDGDEL